MLATVPTESLVTLPHPCLPYTGLSTSITTSAWTPIPSLWRENGACHANFRPDFEHDFQLSCSSGPALLLRKINHSSAGSCGFHDTLAARFHIAPAVPNNNAIRCHETRGKNTTGRKFSSLRGRIDFGLDSHNIAHSKRCRGSGTPMMRIRTRGSPQRQQRRTHSATEGLSAFSNSSTSPSQPGWSGKSTIQLQGRLIISTNRTKRRQRNTAPHSVLWSRNPVTTPTSAGATPPHRYLDTGRNTISKQNIQ
jgi:hypothetical protein